MEGITDGWMDRQSWNLKSYLIQIKGNNYLERKFTYLK